MKAKVYVGAYKYKIYVGAKKYAFNITKKIVEKTLEFLTLPARFISNKIQDLKSLVLYGNSIQSNLPDGYTQLEYIESTGTQGIDTGINPTVAKSTEIQIKLSETVLSGSGSGFGLNTNLNVVNTTLEYWRINGVQTNTTRQVGKIFNITLKQTSQGRYYNINGEEGYGSSREPSGSFYLGVLGEAPGYNLKAKWYYCKILENNQLVQNLVPARRNSDNVLGMYDTVSNTFLTNIKTGMFIAGDMTVPTPSAPIPIESAGDKTKNLFDINNLKAPQGISINKNSITIRGGAGATYYTWTDYFIPAGDYLFSFETDVAQYSIVGHNGVEDDIKINNTKPTYTNSKIKSSMETLLGGYLRPSGNSIKLSSKVPFKLGFAPVSDCTISNIQVEEGDTATPYEPYGYRVPIEIKGKNLFDVDTTENIWISVSGAIITGGKGHWIELGDANTICFICDTTGTTPYSAIALYDENRNFITDSRKVLTNSGFKKLTIDITQFPTAKYAVCATYKGVVNYAMVAFENINAEDYQPYTPPVTQTLYLNEPLRKIGEYADTMSVDGTEVTIVRNVGSYVFDGSEVWSLGGSGAYKYIYQFDRKTGFMYLNSLGLCTSARITDNAAAKNNDYCINVNVLDAARLYASANTTADTFKGGILYLVRQTPTTETYSLPQSMQLQQGTLVFDTDTNIKPSKTLITGDVDNE